MSQFDTMENIVQKFFAQPVFARSSYCDYIAHTISTNLKAVDGEKLLSSVDRPRYDLNEDGSLASTTKVIAVEDRFGKKYRITVEEV